MAELNFFNKILVQKNYNKFILGNKKDVNIYNEYNINDSPNVKAVNNIITEGILKGASDIHIEPFKDTVLVRYRIDGLLNEVTNIPVSKYEAIIIRLKIMANMDIAEKRIPQDGKFELNINDKYYDFRVSIIPTINGEKIVIRILCKNEKILSLDSLGFDNNNINCIKRIINSSHGIVLITGPTGSGKTSTLYTMLNVLNHSDKNIVTIEDPVEYTIRGVNQINVNNKAGLTFANGLRSILRQDPDVIMIGEIRDEETAQIAVRAAITGHLVISTLHTNDAVNSIIRLIDMGVPNYLVADALVAVIGQRLVRKLCPICKVKHIASEFERKCFSLDDTETVFEAKGCPECNYTGYKGRTITFELMYIDDNQRKFINNKEHSDVLRNYSINNGMIPLKEYCLMLVKKGVTSLEEFRKYYLETFLEEYNE